MTDPARRARPVGPPPPPGHREPSGPPSEAGPRGDGSARFAGTGPGGYAPRRMRVYSWSASGRSFPWFAVLLLVLGIGLLIELLIPELSFGSLIILAAGLAFGAAWLVGRVVGATMAALVLTAWGLAGVGGDVGILVGDGWTTFLIGLAFLVGWGLARFQQTRREWALVIGAVLGLIGLADVSDALPFDVSVAVVIPLAMIGIGVYLIVRDYLPRRLGS